MRSEPLNCATGCGAIISALDDREAIVQRAAGRLPVMVQPHPSARSRIQAHLRSRSSKARTSSGSVSVNESCLRPCGALTLVRPEGVRRRPTGSGRLRGHIRELTAQVFARTRDGPASQSFLLLTLENVSTNSPVQLFVSSGSGRHKEPTIRRPWMWQGSPRHPPVPPLAAKTRPMCRAR